MAQTLTTKSAFLDTNALIGLVSFWETCNQGGIDLQTVDNWGQLKGRPTKRKS